MLLWPGPVSDWPRIARAHALTEEAKCRSPSLLGWVGVAYEQAALPTLSVIQCAFLVVVDGPFHQVNALQLIIAYARKILFLFGFAVGSWFAVLLGLFRLRFGLVVITFELYSWIQKQA